MKKILLALAVLTAALPARALYPAGSPLLNPATYVAVATFTLAGTGTNEFALQNTASDQDVRIEKIDVTVSSATAAGGIAEFWVFTSTALTAGGTSQTWTYSYTKALAAAPSAVSLSTGPTNVVLENPLPVVRPLVVSTLSSATLNLTDGYSDLVGDALELLLAKGSSRAIVIQQQR